MMEEMMDIGELFKYLIKMIKLKKKSLGYAGYVGKKQASTSFTMGNMTKCVHLGATIHFVFRNLKFVQEFVQIVSSSNKLKPVTHCLGMPGV